MVKKNFTRKDLSNKVYQKLGFSKNYSSIIIDNFFETLIQELLKSNKIKLSSFGTFKIINTKKRIGRNPKTKQNVIISERNVILFKASKDLKKFINNKNG